MDPKDLRKTRIITDEEAESITRVEELAYEIKVQEVMTRDLLTMSAGMKMAEVLESFRKWRISGAPIVANGKLTGIISIEDLIRCLTNTDLEAEISKYMNYNVITVKDSDPLVEALKTFVSTRVGRLPVVDGDGKLVGIITKGDITRGILNALKQDYQAEEVRRYRASHLFEDIESERTSLILRYNIRTGDFTHGGEASSKIKRALTRMGASPQIARRCGIATYEAEMNLIIHTTEGGIIRVEIEPHQISIDVFDTGPGIKDVALAMRPGYSTASETVRELGFGAGMGLVNISRCVDNMKLESIWGKGTRLRMKINLENQDSVGEGYPARNQEKK
ncbi:MAG TPA: CBS domain-containing protein [Bellilinea sp.]|nr:CBS domain-containing protein [Bellilinea sp.]